MIEGLRKQIGGLEAALVERDTLAKARERALQATVADLEARVGAKAASRREKVAKVCALGSCRVCCCCCCC